MRSSRLLYRKVNNNIFSRSNNYAIKRYNSNSSSPKINSNIHLIVFPIATISASAYYAYSTYKSIKPISMNELEKCIEQCKVEKIVLHNNNNAIIQLDDKSTFFLNVPDYKYLETKLNTESIPIEFRYSNNNSLLYQGLMYLLFSGFIIYFMRKQAGGISGVFQFTKNNQINILENVETKFKDIVGQDNAVLLLREYLDIVKNNDKYQEIGAKTPKGALLTGPPGTGKTLLAKALAGESNLPFVSLSGSDLNAMFVGVGSLKVKNLFENARQKAQEYDGCIVFIDEIDAIGRERGTNGFNVNTERENTLNQLLTEMDGFQESTNVIVLGATNRPEILDKALLRPGRFDRKINVDIPSIQGRKDLFSYYFSKLKLNLTQKQLENIIEKSSSLTPGFSGADISNICNESAIISVRNNNTNIGIEEVNKAIDYVMFGSEKQDSLSKTDLTTIAYHESGHALVSYILENTANPIKVSIIPREKGMLGFSQSEYIPELLISRNYIEDQICVLMAGRACEEIFLQDITNGASNDIEKATELIYQYINLFAMSDHNVFYRTMENSDSFSAKYGNEIKNISDTKALEILRKLYNKTKRILSNNKNKIEILKDSLLENKTIYYEDICKIMQIKEEENTQL